MVCCFEDSSDRSQSLVDWAASFTNAYVIANIPESRWAEFIQGHLSGAAAQEARMVRREEVSRFSIPKLEHIAIRIALTNSPH